MSLDYEAHIYHAWKTYFVSGAIPFVYLTSSPFSGSTLFSFLVNSHPNIATVGEMTGPTSLQDPDTYRCSCGQKMKECTFWERVAKEMASRGMPFDTGFFDTRIRYGNGIAAQRILSGSLRFSALEDIRDGMLNHWSRHRQRLQYLVQRNKAFAASILQVTGRSVFFDASKYQMAIRHFERQPDIDLRVVHLVRDVRGASLSWMKNRGETDWRRAVNAWTRTNRSIERQLRRLPANRWIRIRYEDVCRTPAETLGRFFEFCGLRSHDIPHDFHAVQHHIVGNRMRLINIGQIRVDEGWRRVLTLDDLACAQELAGPTQARYGYPQMTGADLKPADAPSDSASGPLPPR